MMMMAIVGREAAGEEVEKRNMELHSFFQIIIIDIMIKIVSDDNNHHFTYANQDRWVHYKFVEMRSKIKVWSQNINFDIDYCPL